MGVRVRRRRVPDTYLRLRETIPAHPYPRRASPGRGPRVAQRIVGARSGQGSPGVHGRLTDLVAAYEDMHVPMADVSEAEVLRELMRSNGPSQMELAKAVGIGSRASRPS